MIKNQFDFIKYKILLNYKKIKILFVYQLDGCNEPYLVTCLNYLKLNNPSIYIQIVNLKDYLVVNQEFFDVIIYSTFPDDQHPIFFKPNEAFIKKTDQKFLSFKKLKVLFDAHDSGSINGYERFSDKIPRIKNVPSRQFLKKFDCLCSTTYPIEIIYFKKVTKDIDISFCVTLESNEIRPIILKILKDYKKRNQRVSLDLERNKKEKEYKEYLRRVWISVNAPGCGEGCFRHLETLNAGSLMLAHESINDIKLLPNADLVEGTDYVSFNLKNLYDRLDWLLDHKEKIQQISENGYKKLVTGFSPEKTAEKLLQKLLSYQMKS